MSASIGQAQPAVAFDRPLRLDSGLADDWLSPSADETLLSFASSAPSVSWGSLAELSAAVADPAVFASSSPPALDSNSIDLLSLSGVSPSLTTVDRFGSPASEAITVPSPSVNDLFCWDNGLVPDMTGMGLPDISSLVASTGLVSPPTSTASPELANIEFPDMVQDPLVLLASPQLSFESLIASSPDLIAVPAVDKAVSAPSPVLSSIAPPAISPAVEFKSSPEPEPASPASPVSPMASTVPPLAKFEEDENGPKDIIVCMKTGKVFTPKFDKQQLNATGKIRKRRRKAKVDVIYVKDHTNKADMDRAHNTLAARRSRERAKAMTDFLTDQNDQLHGQVQQLTSQVAKVNGRCDALEKLLAGLGYSGPIP